MNHAPVMLNEVMEALSPVDQGVYVDGTFGAGGYTKAILDSADCTVVAIDRDISAKSRAEVLKESYGDRFIFIHGRFGEVEDLLQHAGFKKVDGFVLDLGVSSMQLDEAERGFSFRFDAPLDMRMDNSSGTETAADIVNSYAEEDLADLIYEFGQERHSRKVAKKIVEARGEGPIETTGALAELVRSVVHKSPKDPIDQATRTFQALRIAVNDELGELDRALEAAENILKTGGHLVVVSFHSLEDGRVKEFLKDRSGKQDRGSRHLPDQGAGNHSVTFSLAQRKTIKPSEQETKGNPRARSARLRAGVRVEAAS